VQSVVLLVVVATTVTVLLRLFVVQPFYVPSASMEPGLTVNDRIVVEKASYWFGGEPQRGDLVVFSDPGGWLDEPDADDGGSVHDTLKAMGLLPTGGHLVKRVIGVGGDTIVCCDDQGRLVINGDPVDESGFIAPQERCDGPMAGCSGWRAKVPEGRLFVMGDNRDHSADSSFHLCRSGAQGCDPDAAYVPVDLVVGRVAALLWPLDHAHLVHRPTAFDQVSAPSDAAR